MEMCGRTGLPFSEWVEVGYSNIQLVHVHALLMYMYNVLWCPALCGVRLVWVGEVGLVCYTLPPCTCGLTSHSIPTPKLSTRHLNSLLQQYSWLLQHVHYHLNIHIRVQSLR